MTRNHQDASARRAPVTEEPQDEGSTEPQRPERRVATEQEPTSQVSEAGGGALNVETAEGGADAVPDSHG